MWALTHIVALKQILIQFIGVYYCFCFFNRTEALGLLTRVRLTSSLFAHRAADCDPPVEGTASSPLFISRGHLRWEWGGASILQGPASQFVSHCWELSESSSNLSSADGQEQLCFPSNERRLAACWWNVAAWLADSGHKNTICLIDLKPHNSWVKFVLLAVTVTTQLLRWRVWENGFFFSVNNATFASHLLRV